MKSGATRAPAVEDQVKGPEKADIGDEVNIKRSIEMKNGIALRSMNNFHKGTNAIFLNQYRVSYETSPLTCLLLRVISDSSGSSTT